MSELIELETINEDEIEATKAADNAARQRRWRARRDLEMEGLTLKRALKLKVDRSRALATQKAAADTAFRQLTPEHLAVFHSEVFQEGLPDGSAGGIEYICGAMHRAIESVRFDLGDGARPDWDLEFYEDFVQTYPWAKPLVYPRVKFAHRDDPDAPLAYTTQEFFDAATKYNALSNHDSPFTLADEEPPVVKRKRGRPKGKRTKAKPEQVSPVVDPAVVAAWTTGPGKPQREVWSEVAADRAAIAIKQQQEEAAPWMPVVFPRMNEL